MGEASIVMKGSKPLWRCIWMTVCVVTVTLLAGTARADRDEREREAQKHFLEGVKRVDRGDHEGARLKFEEALKLNFHPIILFNLAMAEADTGRRIEAIRDFRLFLQMSPHPKIGEREWVLAADRLRQEDSKVGHLRVDPPGFSTLRVDGVVIDPVLLSHDGVIDVAPGEHAVDARYESVKTTTERIRVDAGRTTMVKFEGVDVKETAPSEPSEKPVSAPDEASRKVAPPPDSGARSDVSVAVAIASGVVGVAGVATGVAFTLRKNALIEGLPGSCIGPMSAVCISDRETAGDYEKASIVAYTVGGAFIAGAFAFYFLWPRTSGRSGVSVAPSVASGGLRLELAGSF